MTRAWHISLAAALLLAAATASARGDGLTYGIRAKGYLNENGQIVKSVTLVVKDGKITKIGKMSRAPEGAVVLDRSTYYIGPGMIDVLSSVGTMRNTGEDANAMEPAARAADLFNQWHADFQRAARAGITTLLIAPSSTNQIGGVTTIVKTAGADAAHRLLGDGPLKLSLTSRAFNQDRVPTSLQGLLAELRRRIAAARADRKDESAFARWARGETTALVDVDDAADLSILARFAEEETVHCIALHGNYAAERLDEMKSLKQPVVLGTYEFTDPLRYTRAPGILESAGIDFILTSEPPRYAPELLRVGTTIAMKGGASRKAALASVTTSAAKLIGVEKRVGKIAPGMDADFVIYTGDPLRLTSAVHEVFVSGERVYSREAEQDARNGGGE